MRLYLKDLKLELDGESLSIYFDMGEFEPVSVVNWNEDEMAEDGINVALAMSRSVELFYTDKKLLLEHLGLAYLRYEYAIRVSNGHDEHWEYFKTKKKYKKIFKEYVKAKSFDIHGYRLEKADMVNDFEYEVIKSYNRIIFGSVEH